MQIEHGLVLIPREFEGEAIAKRWQHRGYFGEHYVRLERTERQWLEQAYG